ncbi:MAG: two-component regulator propeller domain-containing protein [Bacteroidota bacterium]
MFYTQKKNSVIIVKQILNYSLCFALFISCNSNTKNTDEANIVKVEKLENSYSDFGAKGLTELDKNIRAIFQDKNNNYWFGTNGVGIYRYDGKILKLFTEKDGLPNNQILSIQEDRLGNIWVSTGAFGVSYFNGKTFTTLSNKENLKLNDNFKLDSTSLWFFAGGGAYYCNANFCKYLPLNNSDSKQINPPNILSQFAVYSILKDTKGNIWFGTQSQGVCCFNGKTFTWFTEKGLKGPAVLALFEDSNGNIWIGNNGNGLFKYDGSRLVNFTEQNNLSNKEFLKSGKSIPGTLARIYSINEDNNGELWIGTVDTGVWRYNGNKLSNYTKENGLTSNAINTIYKNKKGELLFATDNDGICKFNGVFFTRFVL